MYRYKHIQTINSYGEIHILYQTPFVMLNNTVKRTILDHIKLGTMLPNDFFENSLFTANFIKDKFRGVVIVELVGETPNPINSNTIPKEFCIEDEKN